MSGTAPSDPAPGGHAHDRGVQQTSLDSNQHGQAQNIIDETNNTTTGITVDRNLGQAIDASKGQDGLTQRVDDLLNTPASKSGNVPAENKAQGKTEEGFRVGERADLHDLAQSKQP
ncbi:uncharacterized protein J7T54_003840 [Emericellopsis cladophorae]|uniref:Uncharacterized protein n=1 Tax=Emericellopsis cladophorae TaxID=2686198 RepID=A0A9P9XWZ9_9HYPO|nr:uncharacterized protein J7T54_003840 [Emericellopsis cladophorae]KAI6778904.1 hypothetical protein J7T54_003840 [Emericellopsis cladophorae]